MEALPLRLHNVQQRIESACHQHHLSQPRLIAVSKTKPAEQIQTLFSLGQRDFGENYLQEAEEKIHALSSLKDICWHFIGPLQSNKAKAVANHFQWIHTVDRLKLAQRLSQFRGHTELPPLQVLIQVNIDGEASKSGVSPDDVMALAQEVAQLPHLTLRGLMAIPAKRDGLNEQRKPFAQVLALFKRLQESLPNTSIDTLSMGMSGDLEAAMMEGSTMVRIGTDIFGARHINNPV